jgi:predicted nucleotidyltransferase
MLTKETIKRTLLENLPLLKRYKVQRIGLFGSYVRNMASKNSDIDLLIVVDLEIRLSDIFGGKVDLVSVKGLNKHLKEHILREAEFVEGI